jgi:hypothetical protein
VVNGIIGSGPPSGGPGPYSAPDRETRYNPEISPGINFCDEKIIKVVKKYAREKAVFGWIDRTQGGEVSDKQHSMPRKTAPG